MPFFNNTDVCFYKPGEVETLEEALHVDEFIEPNAEDIPEFPDDDEFDFLTEEPDYSDGELEYDEATDDEVLQHDEASNDEEESEEDVDEITEILGAMVADGLRHSEE